MKKTLLTILSLAALSLAGVNAQTLLAGWDFQTTANGGTAVAASPNTPTSFIANVGNGTIFLNGTSGSSTFLPASELSAFSGSTLNVGTGMTSNTTTPAALAILGGTGNSTNGKSMVISFSMTGYQTLNITLAAQRTGTGPTTQTWELSTDASNWTSIGTLDSGSTAGTIASSFTTSGVLGFSNISSLDNSANAYLRVTFTGSTAASGNNRIDNIQLNASAIPEPSTWALIGLGSAFVLWRIRRKKSTQV
jgi:hypothetical protein